jgi:glycosyltransferase involved in cell wall biosynthesis
VLPWPLDSGGKIRTYHLLRSASSAADIRLLAVREPGQGTEEELELAAAGVSVRAFDRAKPGPVRRWSRPKLERWFHSPGLLHGLAEELARESWDVLHLDELLRARTPPPGARVPVLQHHHKIDSVLYARTRVDQGAHRHFDLWKLRRLEAYAARRYPHHLVCGPGDRDVLLSRYPDLDVSVLPSGYDPDYFRPAEPERPRERDLILFLGSMDYPPNVDGVLHFTREVLPAIRRERPTARLAVVGRAPAPEVRALASDAVEITGAVDDVRPWLARAALVVVPLRIGGGTRLKIVEALGMGCPVVSTRVGAEGLDLADGREIVLADSAAALARRSVELLAHPETAGALGSRGRARVAAEYGWERLGERLVERWREVAESAGVRRGG